MIEVAKKDWQERFVKLPYPIRAMLLDPDNQFADRVRVICARYELDDFQVALITRLASYLLMGFVLPTEFVKAMTGDAEVPRDKAILISQDLNREFFNDVKDLIMEIHMATAKVAPAPLAAPAAPIATAAPLQNAAPANVFPPQGTTVGPTHVGSIFEQKLGGVFRMKGAEVRYDSAPAASATPAKPVFTIPKKPTEVEIPPAQPTQPPR